MDLDKRLLARTSPAGLAWYYSDGAWIMAPHLNLLSQKVVAAATTPNARLIVTMPPRHGKSELISRFTPAWYLGTFPEHKVMLASYSDQFAASWGRSSREVMENVGPELWNLSVDQEAKGGQHWELVLPRGGRKVLRSGEMNTAGVGGGMTGKGANLLIIDDPIKNAVDAQSDVIREAQHDWWKSTARTRLQADASVILVMTRWHEDDLAGRFLTDNEENWELINFPGICEVDGPDELGRHKGDALWPEMFDAEALDRTRRAMGSYWFGAMYQQRPAPAEGNLFKRHNWRYYEGLAPGVLRLIRDEAQGGDFMFDPAFGFTFQTVDVAGTSKEESDETVVSTWAVTPHHDLVWLDMESVKFESLDVGGFVERKFRQWRPAVIGIERLGFGLTVIQELLRKGLPISRLEPNTDKVARALPAVARTEEHRVYLPQQAEWTIRAIEQLSGFPNATHDDIVDTVSYAALMLPNLHPNSGVGGRTQRSPGMTMVGDALRAQL